MSIADSDLQALKRIFYDMGDLQPIQFVQLPGPRKSPHPRLMSSIPHPPRSNSNKIILKFVELFQIDWFKKLSK